MTGVNRAGSAPQVKRRNSLGVYLLPQRNGRGNNGAYGGGGRGDGGGELIVVAILMHSLDLNQADAGSVSHSRAGHTGKNQGDQYVDVGQSAPAGPNAGLTEVEQFVGNRASVHQIGHEDEHGNGQNGIVGKHTLADLLSHNTYVHSAKQEIDNSGGDQVQRNGQSK